MILVINYWTLLFGISKCNKSSMTCLDILVSLVLFEIIMRYFLHYELNKFDLL